MTRLSIDREALERMWNVGASNKDIAAKLGCSASHVSQMASRLGLKPKLGGGGGRKRQKVDGDALRKVWSTSATQEDMAGIFGCTVTTIRRTANRLGLPGRARGRRKPPQVAAVSAGTVPSPPPIAPLTERLIASGGRYAALAEVAADEGWTNAQAQQRYHRAAAIGRAAPQPGGAR